MAFNEIASSEIVQQTITALIANGISAMLVNTKEEANMKVISLIPEGAEVMNMTSVTLDTIGVSEVIMESGKYKAVKKTLMGMDRATQSAAMQKLGAAPEYAVGSVHAVTQTGSVYIASNTGSQLPAYAYGSPHVIWVVGTQKIVFDEAAAMKRMYEYCLPLESERAHKAYGVPQSAVNKILEIKKEVTRNRLTLIFVNEALGF